MKQLGRIVFYGGLAAGAAAVFLLVSCSGDSVTGPSPTQQTVVAPAPQPVAEAAPAVIEEPVAEGGDTVYFERTAGPGCAGTLVNPTPDTKNVVVHYTPPLVPAGQQDYFTLNFEVPGGGSLVTPSAQEAFDQNYESCEPVDLEVQCDYRGLKGGHIAGRFESVSFEGNEEFCECEAGEWEDLSDTGWVEDYVVDCPDGFSVSNGQNTCVECFQESRTKIQTNGCEDRSQTRTRTNRRRVECPSPEGGICHVSNTGNPNSGNVELRVQLKNGGEGHLGHCADFTPYLISANTDTFPECVQVGPGSELCSCHTAREKWLECDAGVD